MRYQGVFMLKVIWDDFTWPRPTSRKRGFKWEVTGDDMRLVEMPGATFTDYQPGPAIFRDFADLEKTHQAVLNFANRYGPLCRRLEFNLFSDWRFGIQYMRALVALGDAVT